MASGEGAANAGSDDGGANGEDVANAGSGEDRVSVYRV